MKMFKWPYIVAPLFSSIPAFEVCEEDEGKVEEHTRNAALNCVIPVQICGLQCHRRHFGR